MKCMLSLILAVLAGSGLLAAQGQTIRPDLAKASRGQGWTVQNRGISLLEEAGRQCVRLDEKPGDGAAWLEGAGFSEGTIEVDLRGKDVFQRSFVGIAFHGLDEKTYDAVYFRPFNFRSEDPARRSHAVQYISHPANTWQRLRSEHPGAYEKPIEPPPDPNVWFHARIVVRGPKVSVFVNDAREPSLVVERLSDRKGGRVGLWVGNGSGGDFCGFRITPAE